MSQTNIYVSKKVEKVAKELINENSTQSSYYLGDWAATLFHVNHKKCWLLINKLTKYLLILPDIKKADLTNIDSIFKETFYSQLIYDGILIESEMIEKIIGKLILLETNNDRSANGSLNNVLLYFDDWKYEFRNFDNMPFRDLNNRLNIHPNKMLNWATPKEKMNEFIKGFEQQGI